MPSMSSASIEGVNVGQHSFSALTSDLRSDQTYFLAFREKQSTEDLETGYRT